MILVDANLLVYAFARDLPQHERARAWLDDQLNGPARVGIPWESLLAFVRLASNPRIFERPATVSRAWQQVLEWLAADRTWIPQATDAHPKVLTELLGEIGGRANLIPDAHLAALAIEHGLAVCSSDGDFARFSGIRWINPLAEA